jgi:hypothetical protein
MRFLATALALAILITGCTSLALPTDPEWHYTGPGDPCRGVGLNGILRVSTSDQRIFWMENRPTGERADIIWPAGYHARSNFGLEVIDDHNVVVGREGDLITGTCFHGEGGPIHVSAGELQPAP